MQTFDAPVRPLPRPDFDKRHKLQPLDANVFLQPGPALKRIPVRDEAHFRGIVNCRPIAEIVGKDILANATARQGGAGKRRRPVFDVSIAFFIPGR